jgi:hypothetical protein
MFRPQALAAAYAANEPAAGKKEVAVRRVIALTNRERMAHGLPPLSLNRTLMRSAAWIAQDLAGHDTFSHQDSLGRNIDPRIPDFGYERYHAIGENLAAGMRSPEETVRGWMHSEGHRRNILDPSFSEIGVGMAANPRSTYRHYWAEDFGDRFDTHPVVINDESGVTFDRVVHLSLYGGGWARRMRLSNDGEEWTDWESYRSRLDWELDSGYGEHTVAVQLLGPQGVETETDSTLLSRPPETGPDSHAEVQD